MDGCRLGGGSMDYDQILKWQRGTKAEQVAADLASQIKNGNLSKWDSLPLNSALADKWNVSERTISKAKRLLGDQRILTLVDGRYYVA
jgi:DNA-binding GntR family transcriptional regulator